MSRRYHLSDEVCTKDIGKALRIMTFIKRNRAPASILFVSKPVSGYGGSFNTNIGEKAPDLRLDHLP